MPPKRRVVTSLITALLVAAMPVLASIYLAWMESYTMEKTLSLTYAQDVLRRIEATSSQFEEAQQKAAQAKVTPCSPDDMRLLHTIDFGASYIKATGRVAHDTLLCTSQGVMNPAALGKPDLTTAQGVTEYLNKQLSPPPARPLNVFASNGFAVLVDPNLAVSVSTEGPDVELAVLVPSAAQSGPIAVIGQNLPANWLEPVPQGGDSTFIDAGYLVSHIQSAKWDVAVVAATPQRYINDRMRHFALFFVPVGALCGVLLSFTVSLATRMHSSFPAMLRRAIKEKNFCVVYQPVVDLSTRRVIGAEALVRWRSDYAEIRPDYFIPQAEECGLIQLITKQVVTIVGRDLPQFLKLDPDFRVAINMSAADLCDEHTVEMLDGLLAASGALPKNIEVEATERAFLQGPGTASILDTIRSKGFTVAIDDFGTGYSSLACLQTLSLDTLKIDRAFVETINTDGATSQVVLHIIEMARSLHLDIVAEGVETEPQAQYLFKRGVLYAQGWHFGRPMDIAHLREGIRLSMESKLAAFIAEPTRTTVGDEPSSLLTFR